MTTLLSYAFWIGTIVFTIGLGWAAVRFMIPRSPDNPSDEHRRNYVALVIIAGLLMSSAAGITSALLDGAAIFRPGSGGSF